jgi:hypothetical protein
LLKEDPDEAKIESLTERFRNSKTPLEKTIIRWAIERSRYHLGILRHLESSLSILKDEKGIKNAIKHLKNMEQFWSTLSEVEIAANLKRNSFEIELEPTFPSGRKQKCLESEVLSECKKT